MADSFDPYYKWLAIPPEDQPASHYRLLAIATSEQDEEVIANAAEQRISHLRILEMGEQGAIATELIKEIEAARDCLLDAETRASYESQFSDESTPKPVDDSIAAPFQPMGSPKKTETTRRTKSKANDKKAKKISLIGHILAPIVGLALGGIILFVIKSMPSEKDDPSQIDFEIGSMRPDDGQEQEPEDTDGVTEDPETQQLDTSESSLPFEQPTTTDISPAETEAEDASGGESLASEESVDEYQEVEDSFLESDATTDATVAIGEPEKEDPGDFDSAAETPFTEDVVASENSLSVGDDRREKQAALTAAIEIGNLMLQLKLAAEIGKLEGEDSWKREVNLFEEYQQKTSPSDDRSVIQAAIFLSSRAQERGLEDEARAFAIDALRSARREGNPALTRKVTAYILQSSFVESE